MPQPDGSVKTMRDSTEAPRRVREGPAAATATGARSIRTATCTAAAPALAKAMAPWRETMAGESRRARDRAQVQRRVDEVGSRLRPASAPPARDRLEQVRLRVLARAAAAAHGEM